MLEFMVEIFSNEKQVYENYYQQKTQINIY